MTKLEERLRPFGLPAAGLVDFHAQPLPAAIRYLDFYRPQPTSTEPLPDALVEIQQEPVACVVDGEGFSFDHHLPSLRRKIAMRGDVPYLIVVDPGKLTLFEVGLTENENHLRSETVSVATPRAQALFHQLHHNPRPAPGHLFVHDVLFDLLTEAIDHLLGSGVSREDAVSLAGRALFVRFLIDRRILQKDELLKVEPEGRTENLFQNSARTRATCQWLDQTFNGDFLPLSLTANSAAGLETVGKAGFDRLANIVLKARGGQRRFDWGDLDFAHIPVGVLSQVYERQAERWDALGRKTSSIYYTPWRIADYMVREVFAGLEAEGPTRPHECRVLDPAAGGGVFLVAAFERIVEAWWRFFGRPPQTHEIRKILNEQLAGFDISEPALRLAALSLYLKALELDRDPHPIDKLRFDPLRGKVLHDMRPPGEEPQRYVLGSLGPLGEGRHRGAYDVVIGNPPWTAMEGADGRRTHGQMVDSVRRIAADRLAAEETKKFEIPDLVPDLPFVWKAMDWCRPGGWIALALHGRLLFKTSSAGAATRNSLFEAVTVTGILNGTDVRKTNVWPNMVAPFCLLFALNQRANPQTSRFTFVSPYLDGPLNEHGRIRIDASAAWEVEFSRLRTDPSLLKTQFRGTTLDGLVLEKIRSKDWPNTSGRWKQGYKVATRSQDASFLSHLPHLTVDTLKGRRFQIDCSHLNRFLIDFPELKLERPRTRDIFRSPLVLVRESPAIGRDDGRSWICFEDLAFSTSFFGLGAPNTEEGRTFVQYLGLLLHGQLFLWFLLMTSSKFGVERESIHEADLEAFPIPPLEALKSAEKDIVDSLVEGLAKRSTSEFERLDEWVTRVYGLDKWDAEVIRDTLEVQLPFTKSRQRAQIRPTSGEVKIFIDRLHDGLEPFLGEGLRIRRVEVPAELPWELLRIEVGESTTPDPDLGTLFDFADQHGTSQILFPAAGRRLYLGFLRQYRYFTPTRARLSVLEILKNQLQHLRALA